MRVLVTGKGGVGKTTVAASLATALTEAGVEVMAVDGDPNPNLAFNVGAGDPDTLPAVANDRSPHAHQHDGSESEAGEAVTSGDLLGDFGVTGDDGVRLVQAGRIERPSSHCLCCGSHLAARQVLAALPDQPGRVVLGDLEAGLNEIRWTKPGPGDTVLVVTDASRKSREVATRLLTAARELEVGRTVVIANKLRDDELDVIRADFGAYPLVELAHDPSLVGAAPGSDGVTGLDDVIAHLRG